MLSACSFISCNKDKSGPFTPTGSKKIVVSATNSTQLLAGTRLVLQIYVNNKWIGDTYTAPQTVTREFMANTGDLIRVSFGSDAGQAVKMLCKVYQDDIEKSNKLTSGDTPGSELEYIVQ